MELSPRKRHHRPRGGGCHLASARRTNRWLWKSNVTHQERDTSGFEPDTSGVSAPPETGTEETQGVQAGPSEGATLELTAGVSSKPTSGGGGGTTLGSERKVQSQHRRVKKN